MKRNKAPKTDSKIAIGDIDPAIVRLRNNVPLYMIRAGSQPVIRMDITFRAGSWWQAKPLVASSVISMLSEGTTKTSGKEIAGKLDYHGAYLNSSSDRDNAWISAYFLERHMDKIMPLIAEIIWEPVFPEQEFRTYLARRKQLFSIEKTRVSNMARDHFAQAIYGPDHPYGRILNISDFERISREDLADFHSGFYNQDNCRIIVSGNFEEQRLMALVDDFFGETLNAGVNATDNGIRKQPSEKKQIYIPRKGAVQSALRVGKETFPRTHSRYPGLMVVNSLLGGHFGSRLMQNIREKKGYTYGIGSALIGLRNSGFIVIVSEVGTSYCKATIREIYRELEKLRSKPVTKKELELTRTHMLGDILREFDGPFARAETIRNLAEHDLNSDFYRNLIKAIRNIDPSEILYLAGEYLSPDSMYEIVAGERTQ